MSMSTPGSAPNTPAQLNNITLQGALIWAAGRGGFDATDIPNFDSCFADPTGLIDEDTYSQIVAMIRDNGGPDLSGYSRQDLVNAHANSLVLTGPPIAPTMMAEPDPFGPSSAPTSQPDPAVAPDDAPDDKVAMHRFPGLSVIGDTIDNFRKNIDLKALSKKRSVRIGGAVAVGAAVVGTSAVVYNEYGPGSETNGPATTNTTPATPSKVPTAKPPVKPRPPRTTKPRTTKPRTTTRPTSTATAKPPVAPPATTKAPEPVATTPPTATTVPSKTSYTVPCQRELLTVNCTVPSGCTQDRTQMTVPALNCKEGRFVSNKATNQMTYGPNNITFTKQ